MSIVAAENAGPGPCDLQDPLWVKMSTITGNITKKRKKSDAKPQSQINKCLNEKRRRTQENLYIDELAELISATDMSSGKTDKCQILQRTVDQIRHINKQTGSNSHAVQQGEVSSSNPNILSNDQVGPILLEALDGFLFVVNTEGRVEYVTDNISEYINYTKNDVLGKDIYNIIHHGDHNDFMPNIFPMSVGWPNETRNRTFECRFLVKPPGETEETMEEKQQRVNKYETLQICSALLPNNSERLESGELAESDVGPCSLCVARRIPLDEKRIAQFTFRLDIQGKIINVDTSWLSSNYTKFLNKDLVNSKIQDLCHPQDLAKLSAHLKETLQQGENNSAVYRLLINAEQFLHVQTKSRYFKANAANGRENEFIMATMSIFRDNESPSIESGNNGKLCASHANSRTNSANNNNNVGGPLMSVGQLNGQVRQQLTNTGSPSPIPGGNSGGTGANSGGYPGSDLGGTGPGSNNSTFNHFGGSIDIEFDLFSSSNWELDAQPSWAVDTSTTSSRPASTASAQAQPGSRPPSHPSFPFSPMTNQETEKENSENQQQQQQQQQQPKIADSGRLRNLLTKGSSSSQEESNQDQESEKPAQNRILKILLNQQDDDDYAAEHKAKLRTSPCAPPKTAQDSGKSNQSGGQGGGNNMLLQLLNEKSDDDDEDGRGGRKKQHELLQQLLKESDDEKPSKQHLHPDHHKDDPLLRSLGFRNASPSSSTTAQAELALGIGQKRPGEDSDVTVASKRLIDGSLATSGQVTSSGNISSNSTSKLWEKNRMLASLLAKQPTQPATIPPIPASVISATPQDKLPRVMDRKQQQMSPMQQQPWATSVQSMVNNPAQNAVASARTPLQNQSRLPRQATNIYLNQQRSQMEQMDASDFMGNRDYRQTGNDYMGWDIQSSDPDLSEILDQVIEIAPESIAENSALASILDKVESQRSEKLAIKSIQESLMSIESAVSPSSSTMSMPGTPPAYSPATPNHNYQPPPMYQQQQTRLRLNAQANIRPNAGQFTPQHQQQQQQQMQQLQRTKMMQQQQHQLKQRLLHQQQHQQMVIPSNVVAKEEIASAIQNIGSLLNESGAPNVTVQRNSVQESQVSPTYGGSVQMSNQHRLTHSYPTSLPQHSVVNNSFNNNQKPPSGARLSPHSPAGMLSFSHPQPLSPRVTQQGNFAGGPRMFNVNQVRQQQAGAQQSLQQQMSMPSPGTPVSARQSPFPAEAFPPPASPTASQFSPVPNSGNQPAQYRMQRTPTPSASTQLPGGVGSPCHYAVKQEPGQQQQQQPLLSPSHPLSTHNQQNNNQQQHYSNHQHSPMLYGQQNSQYCYDRPPVNLYQTGPGDQVQPPSHPGSHQMGGNSGGGINSEYVRKELRTVVDARMQQQQQQQQRIPNSLQNMSAGGVSQEDFEALGLSFDMATAGDTLGNDGPAKSWVIGTAGSVPPNSRITMEEAARGDQKSSLLQKLLSE